jgi:hypothetical protein
MRTKPFSTGESPLFCALRRKLDERGGGFR